MFKAYFDLVFRSSEDDDDDVTGEACWRDDDDDEGPRVRSRCFSEGRYDDGAGEGELRERFRACAARDSERDEFFILSVKLSVRPLAQDATSTIGGGLFDMMCMMF